ncbi:MAG TPA: general secretion pathway protein GspB [Alicycliphilus denitrificans]|nr:general secretion pathway protein GspB [Alicycliphilus denitrificans]
MSYILDALRRAQAERGRGSVPGLHTPATPAAGLPAADASPARGMLRALLALALGAGLAGGAWWLWRTPSAPAPTPVAAPSTPVAAVAPPAPPAAVQAAPAPAPAAAPASAPRPAQAAPPPRPAQPAARAERRAADAAPAAKAPTPRSAPPKPAEAPAAPVFAQADLPPAVREQLPTLQLAGLTYSSNPLYRMVIVNRQVLHEGDQAAPGLVLERIEPGRTIWSFRGYRYALPVQ